MSTDYKQAMIKELAQKIKAAGFRVFIADSGTYGFYTDASGSRVISFQVDLGIIRFSGNYKSNQPSQTGTGWSICDYDKCLDFRAVFDSTAPRWAVGDSDWKYTNLAQHLASYQKSSKYTEEH